MNVLESLLWKSHSPEQTAALGSLIGRALRGGETIALCGPLGAGKTHFTQGLAKGLEAEGHVVSPTFLLHRIYPGRLTLNHFDFYRLESEDDLESIGFFEVQAQADGVSAIEWAEKFPEALDRPLIRLTFTPNQEETDRKVRIEADGLDEAVWRAIRQGLNQIC